MERFLCHHDDVASYQRSILSLAVTALTAACGLLASCTTTETVYITVEGGPAPTNKPMPTSPPGSDCPGDIGMFNGGPYKPPHRAAKLCTDAQLDIYEQCRKSNDAKSEPCKQVVDPAFEACGSCIESAANDPNWGPIVSNSSGAFYNSAGCLGIVAGDMDGMGCGKAFSDYLRCIDTACSSCADDAAYDQCANQAEGDQCAAFTATVNMKCPMMFEPTGFEICKSFRTNFRAFAAVFCGGGVASDAGVDAQAPVDAGEDG